MSPLPPSPGRPPLLGIRHVALTVRDLEGCARFWTEVMGYHVEWRPDPDNVYLCSGADNLALHRRYGDPEPLEGAPPPDSRLDHIGVAVARADDVDAWSDHLRAHGVALTVAPKTHRDGARSLYFRDPDGIMVQIIHHGPMAGTG